MASVLGGEALGSMGKESLTRYFGDRVRTSLQYHNHSQPSRGSYPTHASLTTGTDYGNRLREPTTGTDYGHSIHKSAAIDREKNFHL